MLEEPLANIARGIAFLFLFSEETTPIRRPFNRAEESLPEGCPAISHVDPLYQRRNRAHTPAVRYPSFDQAISKGRAHLATSSIRATRSPMKTSLHSPDGNRARLNAPAALSNASLYEGSLREARAPASFHMPRRTNVKTHRGDARDTGTVATVSLNFPEGDCH